MTVVVDGDCVVDLRGGLTDEATEAPWTDDTVVVVWSSTKGALALCMHMLADRGEIQLDHPLKRYWPEFGSHGKEEVTLRTVLNHQAGLPGLSQPLPPGTIFDWDYMVHRLECERLQWRPGTRHGYHAVTFGWLLGEVLRRVTGVGVGRFIHEELAGPLNLDFWIGLPRAKEDRVAKTVLATSEHPSNPELPFFRAVEQGQPLQTKVHNSFGELLEPHACNSRPAHAGEIPALNGITNSRGLARMYSALVPAGSGDRPSLVSREAIAEMGAVESASAVDAALLLPCRLSAGFEKGFGRRPPSWPGSDPLVLSEDAFGHSGMGGSLGFADPRAGLAFGYTMNRHAPYMNEFLRSQPLVDAVYACLGYRSRAPGRWIR